MLKFYGVQPPNNWETLKPSGECPHCKRTARFTLLTRPLIDKIVSEEIDKFVLSYSCDACSGFIPIAWTRGQYGGGHVLHVSDPTMLLLAKEPFDFSYIPDEVKEEIEEALSCLAVNAYNGFAAMCRRSIQAICTNLGVKGSDKVTHQVSQMIAENDLNEEWKELTTQIMLSGHDGAHPHLPEINADRAAVLIPLLQDLTYQLYTRPGKIKEAAKLRQMAINTSK